jgi:putative Ca2+/H+ antiporter (TMEM165/GDT1 family)
MKYTIFGLVFLAILNVILSETLSKERKHKSFGESLVSGFTIIFVSELGDRTFFLTMIYAATNSIFKTFIITSFTMLALNALALLVGFYLPIFLYRDVIDWIAIVIFAVFGVMMLYDAYNMEDKKIISEYEDVKESMRRGSISSNKSNDLEKERLNEPLISAKQKEANFASIFTYISSLIIAEIGDKSQISAILLGAINNFYGVLIGTSVGFVCCILAACLAGNILSRTLSTKQLTYAGGIMFLIFSGAYLYEKLN